MDVLYINTKERWFIYMKIITFAAIKGGVGKTTLTYNYGDWLARQGYKILLIDLDHQCNLTTLFEPTRSKNTIAEAFHDVTEEEETVQEVKIDHINSNLDLIAGYLDLDELGNRLENNSNKEMLLFMWLRDNYKKLNFDNYDFILIDTHPDFGTITKNAIAISDYIVSPITPSEHGYNAKFDLEARLEKFRKSLYDYRTGKTYIDAKLLFVANKIQHNTSMSHELLEHIKNDKTVIASIPSREIFNKSTGQHMSVFKYAEQNSSIAKEYKSLFVQLPTIFNNILINTK